MPSSLSPPSSPPPSSSSPSPLSSLSSSLLPPRSHYHPSSLFSPLCPLSFRFSSLSSPHHPHRRPPHIHCIPLILVVPSRPRCTFLSSLYPLVLIISHLIPFFIFVVALVVLVVVTLVLDDTLALVVPSSSLSSFSLSPFHTLCPPPRPSSPPSFSLASPSFSLASLVLITPPPPPRSRCHPSFSLSPPRSRRHPLVHVAIFNAVPSPSPLPLTPASSFSSLASHLLPPPSSSSHCHLRPISPPDRSPSTRSVSLGGPFFVITVLSSLSDIFPHSPFSTPDHPFP